MKVAARMGATGTVRADCPDDTAWPEHIDICVEASGSPAGLDTCVRRVRRGGTVVLLGLLPPGQVGFSGNAAVTREVTVRGAFRFDAEFDQALSLLADGLPVAEVISHTFPLARAAEAFDLAGDRAVAAKVLLDLSAT